MNETVANVPVTAEKQAAKSGERGWAPLDNLRKEIDRLFEDFHPLWRFPASQTSAIDTVASGLQWSMAPAVDMTEKDGQYEITAELPGMDEKNVELKLANGILTIKGEKSEEKKGEKKDYHLSERRYGSFQRSFRLPAEVDVERIEASFTKGLLSVKLPKTAETVNNEKKINIQAA